MKSVFICGLIGPGFDELIIDGVNGFLVPRADPESLAAKMISAWTHPNLARLSEAAKQRMQEFAPEKTVTSLLSYYSEVLNR